MFSARKIIFAKSPETRFPKVSRQSEPSSGGKRPFKIFDFSKKCPPEKNFRLGRSFLQNRLKRVSPKFHADRSYPRGVNGLSKFSIFPKNVPRNFFSPRKIIFAKSSETRFPKVSRRSELSSGGKRLFKIFRFFVNVQIGCATCIKLH